MHVMAELSELQRGQRWAYRIARSSRAFHEVAVSKVGDKKMQVELLAESPEGKTSVGLAGPASRCSGTRRTSTSPPS